MFWTSLRLTNFWSDIFQTLKEALSTNLELNPPTAHFGLPPTKKSPNATERVMAFTTLLTSQAYYSPQMKTCFSPDSRQLDMRNFTMSAVREVKLFTVGIFDSIP